ncbi:MAG: glycosyltransferase family 4 protein [Cyclobacteriaceae bacterium]
MKISYIATYPPNQCGIATFTENLLRSMALINDGNDQPIETEVLAVSDNPTRFDYPNEVKFNIDKQCQADYSKAAGYINNSGSSVCLIQHEYGIYGGQSGVYILTLASQLRVPLVVTLHTVLKEPGFMERSVITQLGKYAQKLVVMSQLGKKFLKEIYEIPADRIEVIEHGVPDYHFRSKDILRKKYHIKRKKVLFTFGLISRNKGIETVINALPKVVKKHPDVLYVVLGNTHPQVLDASGESYRNYLMRLVEQNKLTKHVCFLKKFLSEDQLFEYLVASDVYVTPYTNESQITSGTLSYAVGAGAAIVSTPYWHASELLLEGRGELFNFQDSDHLSTILLDLFDHPEKLREMRVKAFNYGRQLRWPLIGGQYVNLCKQLRFSYSQTPKKKRKIINLSIMPEFSLDHLMRLTDDTGILQHAKYGIPNLKEGYCLDDNSRALLASTMAYNTYHSKEALNLMPVYFSYVHHMQNIKGTFRNFMSFERSYLDDEGSEDAFGRSIWALGYLIRFAPHDAYFQLGREIFLKASKNFSTFNSLRGIANALIGITHYMQKFQSDERMFVMMEELTDEIMKHYKCHAKGEWKWFEDSLTYDNAIIPLALYHSAEITRNAQVMKVAEASKKFLESVVIPGEILAVVGSNGWFVKGNQPAQFAQQATDVMAMVLLYFKAYELKKRKADLKNMFKSFSWFIGENDLRIPLYDQQTHGCADGLESFGVNRNMGAESTVAYLISYMTVIESVELEHRFDSAHKKGKIATRKRNTLSRRKIDPHLAN